MVWQAYKKVKANKGSAGIDGMNWEYLETNAKGELYKLWNRLSSGSYYPQAVKQVTIGKKDGGVRHLGIPSLLDRIAQEVVKHQLEKVLEPKFHASSFGYRPQKSCHDALSQAQRNTFNHDFVIDLDIKGFFDTINHDLLMRGLRHYSQEKWVLQNVERWLKAGTLKQDGELQPTTMGTPQGGVISPILANLFLHIVFDKWMEREHPEKPFERYADDIVVHCKTEKQAQYLLQKIAERMQTCQLALHPQKTKIVNLRGTAEKRYRKSFDFLGYSIRPQNVKFKDKYKVVPSLTISIKSRSALLSKFKAMHLHKRRTSIYAIAKAINPVIRGIMNYYHKYSNGHMRYVWNQLNARLLKWVKWEKGLYKYASIRWLKQKYKQNPNLFLHWQLVHP